MSAIQYVLWRLAALPTATANRFYRRHGLDCFQCSQPEWTIHFLQAKQLRKFGFLRLQPDIGKMLKYTHFQINVFDITPRNVQSRAKRGVQLIAGVEILKP